MFNQITFLIFNGTIVVCSLMLVLWVIQLRTKNAGVVDLGWVLGLVILAALYSFQDIGYPIRKLLILAMVSLWALRLAFLLLRRLSRDQKEDSRYQKIREGWKTNVNLKFLFFFQFQAILDVILSTPFLIVSLNPRIRLSGFELLGILIWFIAVIGESLADEQLYKFKSDPQNKGKTCQVGLWQYSRHPNYFFESLVWIGYFVFALGSPWGWVSVFCPILMLYFLLKVSGVPLAEEQSLLSRGEEYRQYQRTTSVFVPWFRKK